MENSARSIANLDEKASGIEPMVDYLCNLPPELSTKIVRLVDQRLHKARIIDKTLASLQADIEPGDRVKIMSGPYSNIEGKVINVRRSRCYVQVRGRSNPLYLYRSDVSLIP